MLLNDKEIRRLALTERMITPFVEKTKTVDGVPVPSFGLDSYGYDIRMSNRVILFNNPHPNQNVVLRVGDPLPFEEITVQDKLRIPPHAFFLGHSLETFIMPKDVIGKVEIKSSHARIGLLCLPTTLKAGWPGVVTLEFKNLTPYTQEIDIRGAMAHIIFQRGPECEQTYQDHGGLYVGQAGITGSRI